MPAAHLVFVLGPRSGTKSWGKVFAKIQEHATLRARSVVGQYWSTVAYNTFIAAVLGFVLQLEKLPSLWPKGEAAMLRHFVPGPGVWISTSDLHTTQQGRAGITC